MTGEEFKALIEKDPSWCKNLKEPLEITTFANLEQTEITHLSPLITFSGEDKYGWTASFHRCRQLEVATGTFKGFVQFSYTSVKTIESLNTLIPQGLTAAFYDCPIKYVPKKYRGTEFIFNKGIVKKSIKKDITNATVKKIKSEENKIEI